MSEERAAKFDDMLQRNGQVIVTLGALLITLIAAHGRSTQYNNYTLLADAFVHGRFWIDWPGPINSDALNWLGHWYVIEAPVPGILMMPLVLVFGKVANQTTLAILLTAFGVAGAWDLFERLGVSPRARLWLCAYFFAGTDLWWCGMLGDVWFVAQCSAATFTVFALRELAAPSPRGWVVALCAAAAFESRFTLVTAVPFYAYFLWRGGLAPEAVAQEPAVRMRALRSLVLTLVPVAALWLWYDLGRWGVWYDIGYTTFYHRDPWGQPTGSPFRLAYFPYELYSFFLQAPVLVEYRQLAQWPIFKVDVHGIALTWSSPALALAFFAPAPRRYLAVMWTLIAVVAAPSFLYYLNGWYQYGMRHALDFEPYLLVLMALVARRRIPLWGMILIGISIAMSAWGVWYWNVFYRAGS